MSRQSTVAKKPNIITTAKKQVIKGKTTSCHWRKIIDSMTMINKMILTKDSDIARIVDLSAATGNAAQKIEHRAYNADDVMHLCDDFLRNRTYAECFSTLVNRCCRRVQPTVSRSLKASRSRQIKVSSTERLMIGAFYHLDPITYF